MEEQLRQYREQQARRYYIQQQPRYDPRPERHSGTTSRAPLSSTSNIPMQPGVHVNRTTSVITPRSTSTSSANSYQNQLEMDEALARHLQSLEEQGASEHEFSPVDGPTQDDTRSRSSFSFSNARGQPDLSEGHNMIFDPHALLLEAFQRNFGPQEEGSTNNHPNSRNEATRSISRRAPIRPFDLLQRRSVNSPRQGIFRPMLEVHFGHRNPNEHGSSTSSGPLTGLPFPFEFIFGFGDLDHNLIRDALGQEEGVIRILNQQTGQIEEYPNTYEGLIALSERLGQSKPMGAKKEEIESLPSFRYQITTPPSSISKAKQQTHPQQTQSSSQSSSIPAHQENQCAICLASFEKGDELVMLPQCTHQFHKTCIFEWLIINRTCPICRMELSQQGDNSNSSS